MKGEGGKLLTERKRVMKREREYFGVLLNVGDLLKRKLRRFK